MVKSPTKIQDEMLSELEAYFKPKYPAHAKSVYEIADALGISVIQAGVRMGLLYREGKYHRSKMGPGTKAPYVYWKAE